MALDYFALGLLVFVGLVIFYGVIVIHDIPYEIAKHRNHPHQDAIHVAGWVSLFTLHVLWPFLWIWATLIAPIAAGALVSGCKKMKRTWRPSSRSWRIRRAVSTLSNRVSNRDKPWTCY